MSNVTTIKPFHLAPTLGADEREFIQAKTGDKIMVLKKSDIKIFLATLISKTHLECGQVQDTDAIKLTINDLVSDVINYAGGFTLDQISHAFKLGAMKEFGEWYGLNANTYRQWIRGYMGYQKRLDANKKQEAYLKELNKPKELTQEEKDKIIHEGALKAFEDFKEKGFVIDAGNVTYNYLDRLKLIPFTIEIKRQIMEQAKQELIALLKEQKSKSKDIFQAREIEKTLTDLDENKLKSEAKRKALNIFFSDLLEIGKELKELINNK